MSILILQDRILGQSFVVSVRRILFDRLPGINTICERWCGRRTDFRMSLHLHDCYALYNGCTAVVDAVKHRLCNGQYVGSSFFAKKADRDDDPCRRVPLIESWRQRCNSIAVVWLCNIPPVMPCYWSRGRRKEVK